MLGVDVVDAFHCYRHHSAVEPFDPALCLQIPEMEFQFLRSAAGEAFDFEVGNTGVPDVAAAPGVEHQQKVFLDVHVVFDDLDIARFLRRAGVRTHDLLMKPVIRGPFRFIAQDAMGLDETVEQVAIAAQWIVWVVALRQPVKATRDVLGAGSGNRTQHFIVIDEIVAIHGPRPTGVIVLRAHPQSIRWTTDGATADSATGVGELAQQVTMERFGRSRADTPRQS